MDDDFESGHEVARTFATGMSMDRRSLGLVGEEVAARYLASRGVDLLERRRRVDSGDIDLVGSVAGTRVAFEVRTTTSGRPLDAFGPEKYDRVWSLALRAGYTRVDLVAVQLGAGSVLLRWVPGVTRG